MQNKQWQKSINENTVGALIGEFNYYLYNNSTKYTSTITTGITDYITFWSSTI